MKTFVFILKSKRQGQLNEKLLKTHVEHLQNLSKSSHLVLCGPFQDNDQALQIIRADTKKLALSLFQKDPFISQKYYQEYEVHELLEANEANQWLMNSEQTKKNLPS